MTFDLGSAADRVQINAQKSVTLKATDGGGGAATGLYLLPVYTIAGNAIGRNGRNGGNQLGIGQDVSYTLTAADRHCVAVPECEAYRLSGYGIVWRIVYRIRRLTPTECERLDGFPDGWTQQDTKGNVISDNARYMALGNSIAVPCAVRVFRGIMAVEAEVAGNADNDN